MDMDFLTDFSDLAPPDFIGGIDNDGIDFGQLEQFMQDGEQLVEQSNNNQHGNAQLDATGGICNPKIESPTTSPMNVGIDNVSLSPLTTVAARVNLTSTPIATPLAAGATLGLGTSRTHSHLPESPPDSGSEPPYSPLQDTHGLTLTARDLYHGMSTPTVQQQQQQQHQQQQQQQHQQQQPTSMHDLNMTPQYTPPHQSTASIGGAGIVGGGGGGGATPTQNHYAHHMAMSQESMQQHSLRIKHESGLIMNPSSLLAQHLPQHHQQQQQQQSMLEHQTLQQQQQAQQQQQQAQQQQQPASSHLQHHNHQTHDIQQQHHSQLDQHQLMFQHANQLMPMAGYDNPLHSSSSSSSGGGGGGGGGSVGGGIGLYGSSSYQNIAGLLCNSNSNDSVATCMLTSSLGEATRVQVIGTSQASLDRSSVPTTPVHSTSRKRKMSTQPDCPEFGHIKHDPGLVMSPLRASHHSLTHEHAALGATSPIRIKLQAAANNGNELPKTPVHSHSSASVSPALSTVNSNAENSLDGHSKSGSSGSNAGGGTANGSASENGEGGALTPCIRFGSFQPENWHKLCDQSLQELSVVYYRVDADKGFNFSVSDDAFVCQKKNHFQVTCHARLQGDAKFVKTPSGLEKIKSFHLHFFGVKLEAPNQTIRVEQSQSDRSKKPFYPVPIDLQSHIVSKVTVGRLHFSETTNNNMRKKGRPNPEQRYFQLVVGLHVHTTSGNFPVISQSSERIIVRASNPGQFESDVDLCWQRGITQDSIFHAGRVGINTDRPDESLVVHGNLKVSGHIVQPSDSRAKQEIGELDTSVQLRNLQKIRIVRYRYEPEFAVHSGLKRASESDSEEIVDTGVIAQEVREVIPDAVQEAGSIVLPNGNVIEKFLLVNKDRILMENIGAVKELCKVTGSLETRIEHLERANNRITRTKELEQRSIIAERSRKSATRREGYEICSSRSLQIIIFLLIIVMAACLAAVSTLYFVEHNKQQHNLKQLESYQVFSNGHIFRPDATAYITDQDRHYLQHNFHTFLNKNKTHGHWPSLIYAVSTTRPPAAAASSTGRNGTRTREELLSYSGEIYGAHSNANDELAVVMEKPIVNVQTLLAPKLLQGPRITTTAPLLRNKTISTKNKSKWPLPQEVLRTAASNQNTQKLGLARNLNSPNFGTVPAALATPATSLAATQNFAAALASNETSSEKVPETGPLSQDFENNSIDIDAQHIIKKTLNAAKLGGSNGRNAIKSTVVGSSADVSKDASIGAQASEEVGEAIINANSDTDITLKLSDPIVVETIASTSSSNSIISVPDTTATAGQAIRKLNTGDAVIYNVYKAVSPPTANLALTTNKVNTESSQTNISIESLASSETAANPNISRAHSQDNPDAADLQNLSNTNESVDNAITALFGFEYTSPRESSLGRRSATQSSVEWITHKTIKTEIFGQPTECNVADVSHTAPQHNQNCQTVCYEQLQLDVAVQGHDIAAAIAERDRKKLLSASDELSSGNEEHELTDTRTVVQIHEPAAQIHSQGQGQSQSREESSAIMPGKESYATSVDAKQHSKEHHELESAESDDDAAIDSILSQVELSAEHLNVAPKIVAELNAHLSARAEEASDITQQHNQRPALDGWTISASVLAEEHNQTIDKQKFYPSLGKSLNITYIVPLSRYLKADNIEVQLSTSKPLQWHFCSADPEQNAPAYAAVANSDGGDSDEHVVEPPLTSHEVTVVKQRSNTKIILAMSLPQRGYFLRDFMLRASTDLEQQKLCDDNAHLANTILQYNFRIVRDCD